MRTHTESQGYSFGPDTCACGQALTDYGVTADGGIVARCPNRNSRVVEMQLRAARPGYEGRMVPGGTL
jgi:hypothetical protein